MEEKKRFSDWMIKVKNIHYANSPEMLRAYENIIEPEDFKNRQLSCGN